MEKEKKGRAIALLPIGVFLIIFLGAGIVFKDFYAMPAIVAFLIALFVAFLQNKELSFNKKIEVIAKGVGEENIITMSLIFLCAGGFSGAVTAAGGVDSTVNLGLSLIPAHFAVAGLFLIGCFISVSMGTSMGTIAACLFVFGLFYFVLSNFQNILHSAEQSVGISVFFEENLSEKQIADIGKKIEKRDEVERIEYISAAQAWEDFKQENFSKTPELAESFGDDNPLAESASYAIYCKDLERQSTLVKYLKNVKGIRRIKEADEIEEGFSSVNKLVGGVSLVLIVVLLLVSVFLIHSTIATGIAVRKPEIAIMRLMGASDFFIWAPFIVEGVVIGLIGSILPLIVLGISYGRILTYITTHFSLFSEGLAFLTTGEVFVMLVPISLILGIGIGFFGSFITVRRNLNI